MLEAILKERGNRYGSYRDNAELSQGLKELIRHWAISRAIGDEQMEALDMIALKISRIVTGDSTYVDNWDDIAGYATLVANSLRRAKNETSIEKTQ